MTPSPDSPDRAMLFLLELLAQGGGGAQEEDHTLHEHRCACGTRWQHRPSDVYGKGVETWRKAHDCPSCGTRCVDKYPCTPRRG